jgi:hypothetical protein
MTCRSPALASAPRPHEPRLVGCVSETVAKAPARPPPSAGEPQERDKPHGAQLPSLIGAPPANAIERADQRGSGPTYFDIENAAHRLSTSPTALRARCRRNARREGRAVTAQLGGGITAIKLGASWRLRFPD